MVIDRLLPVSDISILGGWVIGILQNRKARTSHLRVRVSSPLSFAIFQQHLKVVHLRVRVSQLRYLLATFEGRSSTSSRFVTLSFAIFRQHLKVVHLRVRISSPSSLAIFYQHLKVVHLRVRVWSPLSFAIFQQHLKVVHLRVRVSSPSSFAIFWQHLKVFHLLACSRLSVVGDEQKRAIKKRGRTKASLPFFTPSYGEPGTGYSSTSSRFVTSSFAIFQKHLAAFKGLASTRSRFVIFELTQNINKILCDCILSNLQINMLTTYMNVNFNKKVETLIFSTAVYIHSKINYQKRWQLQ